MKKKYKMDFRSRGDYLLFAWMISLATLIGIGTIINDEVNWFAFLYFFIGMYSSLVLVLWVKRNRRMWEESLKDKCPYCGSSNTKKAGFYYGVNGTKQKYECNSCGRGFRKNVSEC